MSVSFNFYLICTMKEAKSYIKVKLTVFPKRFFFRENGPF